MKRIVISTVILLVLSGMAYPKSKFWQKAKQALGNIATSAGGAVMDRYLINSGYSKEESRKMISDFSSAVGIDSYNIAKGMAFMDGNKKDRINMMVDATLDVTGDLTEKSNITNQIKKGVHAGFDVSNADNNYEKANTITGAALDMVGDYVGNHEITNKIATYVSNELTYRSDVSKAETLKDLQEAVGKKSKADKELIYDVGMAIYDHIEEKKKSPKGNSSNINPVMDVYRQPSISPVRITALSPSEQGEEKKTASNVGPIEEQEALESSEVYRLEAFNAAQKEIEETVTQERKDVVLSDIPQESKSVIVASGLGYPMYQPVRKPKILQEQTSEENEPVTVGDKSVGQTNSCLSERKEEFDVKKTDNVSSFPKQKSVPLHADMGNVSSKSIAEEPVEWEVAKDENQAKIQLENIKMSGYAMNEVSLSIEKTQRLDEIAANLKRYPELRITLIVYISADEDGKTKGYERAREAREYLLIKKGIGSERVFIKNMGASNPLMADINEDASAKNRRIEIAVFRRGDPDK